MSSATASTVFAMATTPSVSRFSLIAARLESPGLLIAEERGLAYLFTLPGIREWWDENPYAFSPEFRSYIEQFR